MGVRNRDGALYFASGIDNSGMYRDADETKRIVGGITEQVRRAGMVMGAVFGATTLANFGQQIIKVRGEMQMLESSFETLLGGRSQADKMITQIKEFAIESPLSLTGVSKAAQTLLGFNVEAEKTIPILKQIGDIAMGDDQRFASLTLAFAQMSSAGKLMGQDLLQMINAGFNPLQEISEKTGKSISVLKKEMETGAISSDMVADAFRSATAEGGKFYGMTQKQAEGIKGWQAQIQGSVQEVFNELGKSSEKFITGAYKVTNDLINNYETIGRAIAGLVTTYGAYRAAVVAVTVAESGWTIASMAQYKWLLLVEKAQKLLNMTMLKNPFVAVTTAVVGLITVIATFNDRTTIAEKAQQKLNDTLKEAKDRKEALQVKGNELIATLNSETATVYQQIKAYKELLLLLPGLKGKSLEDIQKMDPNELGKMLSARGEQAEIDNIQAQYDERIKNIEGYRREIKRLTQSGADSATISYYREQLGIAIEETRGLKKQLDEFASIQKEAFYQENPEARRKDLQSERVALLQKEAELTERIKDAGDNDLASANDRLALQAIQSQLEINKTALESIGKNANQNIDEQIEQAKAKVSNLKTDLANLRSGKTESKDYKTDIEKKEKDLKEAEEALELLTGISKKEGAEMLKNATEISQGLIQVELNLNKERISILKDGREKRLKESEQEWKEQKASLDKEYADRVAKYKELGKNMPSEEKGLFDSRYSTNDDAKGERDKAINKEYDDQYINRVKEVSTIFLNEEEKKRDAIKKRYEDERKWAKLQLDAGSISGEQYNSYVSLIDESEIKEQRDRLLSGLNDYKAQEKAIHEQWDEKILEATASGDTELLQRLNEGKEKALGELNAQMLMQSDEWLKLFENMDTMTAEQIQKLADTIRKKAKDLKLDPANLEAIMKHLREADDQIRQKNPFNSLVKSIKAYKEAEGDVAKGDAFRNIAKNAGASLDQVGSIFNSITDGLKQMGIAGDEETQKMLSNIDEMIGGAATLAKGIATGNPANIIAGGIKLITSAINVFDKKSRDANRTIKKNQESVERLQKSYEDLERAINKTYSTKAASLLEDEQRNLQQQRRLIQDNIRAEKRKKKPDKKAIKEWENLLNDIDVRIEENKDRMVESLTGTDVMTAIDEFAQAYADAWSSGEDAAKKSADVVKGILRNALINYMKGQLQPEVDRLMNKIADSIKNDGRIDTAEQNAIDALLRVLDDKAAQYKQALDPYLDNEKKKSGVTGELKAEMTEQTGTQLVGLWTMSAMDTRAIKEHLENNPMPNVSKELYAIQGELAEIKMNTRETADNTNGIKDQFETMNEKLENIEKNTKPNNSRG